MDLTEASVRLIQLLRETLSELGENTAIAFSGGIDSTLLLHLSDYTLIPYTTGIAGSRDLGNASRVSDLLNFKINKIIISPGDVNSSVSVLRGIDPEMTQREAGYETVLYTLLHAVPEDNVVTGQGSDELFYGYRKYIDADMDNSADLSRLFSRTLPRERRIAEYTGKMLVTPYLSDGVIHLGSMLQKSECISGETNKLVVRKAAELAGLPEEICMMPKKAAQYGSGVQKIINSRHPEKAVR